MNIAILGTRGVPNKFGGFEQCAEKIGAYFARHGHSVTVYNQRDHEYDGNEWNNIRIKHIYSNEKRIGFLNVFVFDYLSLRDAVQQDFDIILELGAAPCALYYYLRTMTKAKLVTNMAGLEWKRSKWNWLAKKVIKFAEELAVKKSDAVISDNVGIQEYISSEYGRSSHFIAYGAELYNNPNEEHLKTYGLSSGQYYMLVARFQPDNNFEMILDGYAQSKAPEDFIVVGGNANNYGSYLKEKYKKYPSVRFVGGIYDYDVLSSLRWHAKMYFHGHSCGGTNPSLLEAMASSAYIAAHNNPFNRHVLGANGYYFKNADEVASLIRNYTNGQRPEFVERNREAISKEYRWEDIAQRYLDVFYEVLNTK